MSKKMNESETSLRNVVVDPSRPRIHTDDGRVCRTTKINTGSEFVYVNPAFVGSVNSVNQRLPSEPPTSVIREQYWACSRWPHTQKILAAAIGVLLGAVVGLAITVAMRGSDDNIIGGIFRSSAPD